MDWQTSNIFVNHDKRPCLTFGARKIQNNSNTFNQQGSIKWIKSDHKTFIKVSLLQIICSFGL